MKTQIKLLVLVVALSAVASQFQVLGSAIKGLEQPAPSKGGLEAPAAKGRVLERQQQKSIETVEEPKQEQLKAGQEELQVSQLEEIRSSKTGARKQEQPAKQELLPAETAQKKLDEPQQQQQQQILEKIEAEPSKTRYEAKPQIVLQHAEQQEQVKFVEGPLEQQQQQQQQRINSEQYLDKQEQLVELRLPEEQQRKLPEPFPAGAAFQQQIIYQQREEELQQQQQQVRIGAAEAEPYSFSYAIDGSSRSESGDTKGVVRGQYTLQGADGSRRIVDYVADQDGFRASVNTNEFGTEARSPAAVALRSSQPSAEEITLRLEGKTRGDSQQQVQQLVQQEQQYTREYAAVKGTPALVVAAPAAPVKGLQAQQLLLPVLQEAQEPVPAAAVKRAAAEPAARKEPSQELPQKAHEESSKSAELLSSSSSGSKREPKALKGQERETVRASIKQEPATRSSSFESATAHRDYRPRQVLRQQPPPSAGQQQRYYQPATRPLHQQPQYQPARQYPPPSPAAANFRRYPTEAARNPRVSFYSAPAASVGEEIGAGEQPSIGFDSRSA